MKRFENKNVLITGSTQGIGAACATRFASEGANIILNGLNLDAGGEEMMNKISLLGGKVKFVADNVSKAHQSINLVNEAVKAFGSLDILVNNAGVERNKNFWEVTEEEYDLVMDTNLKGAFFGTQAFTKYCIENKRSGVVVNMSSVHEEIIFPHFAAYCASKGGLKMLMRNLATELAPLNIRINNVAPGAIGTPINQKLMADQEKLEKVTQNIPMKRMGTPEEVAALVAFLASDDASYITGSTYFIDGGLTYHYEEQ
ncbi:MAG: glucose 1-dehydrogenase [Sphingobacteriales bacterium]|nr:glucose 1-dehydrogenase [Sphingobacteriales bacterium]